MVLMATDQKPQNLFKNVIVPTITLPECQRDAPLDPESPSQTASRLVEPFL